jgi:diphthamide biosynthesis protein 7
MESSSPPPPFTTLDVLPLPLCPDTLERDDEAGALLCCSYFLDKENGGTKRGAIDLLDVRVEGVPDDGGACPPTPSPHPLPRLVPLCAPVSTAAVFDARWAPRGVRSAGGARLFAAATAGSGVAVYGVEAERDDGDAAPPSPSSLPHRRRRRLCPLAATTLTPDDDAVSALYVDWLMPESAGSPLRLCVPRSDGRISLLELSGAGSSSSSPSTSTSSLEVLSEWQAHTLAGMPIEVWVCAASPHSPSLLWSGGDDAKLKGWDVRSPPTRPLFTSGAHGMGVTSVVWHPLREHSVVTGSYDERILLWDDREVGRGPVAEVGTGGGVWRMRWRTGAADAGGGPDLLAAACMYAGVRVLKVDVRSGEMGEGGAEATAPLSPTSSLTPVLHHTAHTSIAYGVEWIEDDGGKGVGVSPRGTAADPALVASCSFYDQQVHLWRPSAGVV